MTYEEWLEGVDEATLQKLLEETDIETARAQLIALGADALSVAKELHQLHEGVRSALQRQRDSSSELPEVDEE